nr:MAG TPA: Chromatin remodeling complex ATPase [Caudoviricetes sp.]
MQKKGNSIYISITDTDDAEEESLLGEQLSSLPKIKERSYNYFEVPIRYFHDVLDALSYWDLEITGDIPKDVREYIESRNRISQTESTDFEFKTKPFEHQLESFEYAKEHPCFLLGDEQGLGKTKQAIDIAVSRKNEFSHCLIVCCVSGLKWNWAKEVEMHSDEKAHIVGSRVNRKGNLTIDGVKKRVDDLTQHHDEYFLITNIETLRDKAFTSYLKELTRSGEIGMVVVDEIHKCKNPTSQQGKALHSLNSFYKIGLSGTPLLNSPVDTYNILKWIGVERHSFSAFKERYCVQDNFGQVTGYRNLKELKNLVMDNMLRRTKEQVLDLPEKIRSVDYVDMSADQTKIYNEVRTKLIEDIDKVMLSTNPLAETIRLRQATGNPEVLTTKKVKSAKFERALEIIQECIENNQSVIVFSNWEKVISPFSEQVKSIAPCYLVTGETDDKFEVIEQFTSDSKSAVICGTIGALGTGFTLTKANTVIFLDSPWTKGEKDQAEDRAHRIGATSTVSVITLVCKNTVDETIEDIVASKGEIADYIVDGVPLKNKLANLFDTLLRK